MARWVWGREWGSGGLDRLGVFEDEVKRFLGKCWVTMGGALLRTNVKGATSTIEFNALDGDNSGATTPYGHPFGDQYRSVLGKIYCTDEDIDMEDKDSPYALPESVPGPIREMSRNKLAIESLGSTVWYVKFPRRQRDIA